MEQEVKKMQCPHCKEEINAKATRCPHCQGKIPQGTFVKLFIWSVVAVLLGVLAVSSIDSNTTIPPPAPVTPVVHKTQAQVFDVPSLIGLNVDQVVAKLGTFKDNTEPTKLQMQTGVDEWNKTYEKDGRSLLITYNPTTRKVTDFFIETNDPSGVTTNTLDLLRVGNLTTTDPKYKVEFVHAIKGDGYTGVKVTPKV